MKNINYKIPIIILLLVIVSCNDDYLDLKPIARPSVETYYSDFSGVDATVTGAYAQLCAREVFDKDYFLVVGSLPCDDAEGGGEGLHDYPEAQNIDQFEHSLADDAPLEEIWRYCYKGLRFCNTAYERLATIKEVDPDASDALIAQRKGEVQFLNGLYHLMLVQVFGGVPVADHKIQPSDFSNPRNSIKEVFTHIENCFKEAIPLLPEKNELGADIGRATKGAAQAFLAKVLIYESSYAKNYSGDERFNGCLERWPEALSYADEVINSTENYGLAGEGGERFSSWRTGADLTATIDGYRWLFTADGDNSMESIFEIQGVFDNLGYAITRGNVLTVYQTVRNYYVDETTVSDGYGGWSWNSPTEYLIQAFQNNDPRETNLNSSLGNETDDPRFATTVGREGDSILLDDATFVMMNFDNLTTGYIGRKFECGYSEYWIGGDDRVWEGPFNLRLMRLADLLLLAAEAALETGDDAKALAYVNRVRTRARNCGSTGFPQNLSIVSFEDIVHERRLELAMEPHRFFDLVRWNLTDEFLNGIGHSGLSGFTLQFVKGKHEFFPIPLSEIQLSEGGLVNYSSWQ